MYARDPRYVEIGRKTSANGAEEVSYVRKLGCAERVAKAVAMAFATLCSLFTILIWKGARDLWNEVFTGRSAKPLTYHEHRVDGKSPPSSKDSSKVETPSQPSPKSLEKKPSPVPSSETPASSEITSKATSKATSLHNLTGEQKPEENIPPKPPSPTSSSKNHSLNSQVTDKINHAPVDLVEISDQDDAQNRAKILQWINRAFCGTEDGMESFKSNAISQISDLDKLTIARMMEMLESIPKLYSSSLTQKSATTHTVKNEFFSYTSFLVPSTLVRRKWATLELTEDSRKDFSFSETTLMGVIRGYLFSTCTIDLKYKKSASAMPKIIGIGELNSNNIQLTLLFDGIQEEDQSGDYENLLEKEVITGFWSILGRYSPPKSDKKELKLMVESELNTKMLRSRVLSPRMTLKSLT